MSPPRGLRWRSHPLFIVFTVGMGAFVDLFLYGLIVPVLPFLLKDRINLPDSQIQSTISNLLAVYAAASCAASPIAGILADKWSSSRQLPFLLGLVLLLLSTILLALGRSVAVLAIARFLQGASGGVVWTIGIALVIETVGNENLGKTMGTIFSFISVAGLFSPMVGGLLYARTGYKGVFGVGVSLIGIDFILRVLVVEKKVAAKYSSPDSHASEPDGNDHEDTEQTPLLPNSHSSIDRYRLPKPTNRFTRNFPILMLFRDASLLTAIWIGFMQALLLGSFDATVPLVASEQFGFDSLKAGLLFLPLGGADFLLGPVFGWCVDRYGTKPAARLDNGRLIALYSGLLAMNGVGLAAINSPSFVEAGNLVEKYYKANEDMFDQAPYAQLYGINSMVWSGGLTVGPLLAGKLRETIGYGNMNAVLAGICGCTVVLAALFVGGRRKD
ncbi:MFS general substrate transporter [Alternaria alternata]|uniref:MFS general substrate transporter n=1 Tax=Alternaria alternata TaxID=5599 RepID=A0A177DLA4_ALTAL|nr:MFS general substrate transporter [Alternaria alternata]OAG20098.1 MFS general substrate transporter [Alternaria alternata]